MFTKYMCTVYIYFVYINSHICMYIFKEYMLYLCLINIIYTNIYMYIYIYIYIYICVCVCKYFLNTCMCVHLYIHNKYTQYTHILCKHKLLFLDAMNRLTAIIILCYNTL